MYMIKSSGPRMDPWGTPHIIGSRVNITESRYHHAVAEEDWIR